MVDGVEFHGKIHVSGKIKLLTGLHIGASSGSLEIGGVDKPIIRDPFTNLPYIPGSSLKGKMRSLLEKALGKATADNLVFTVGKEISMHLCNDPSCEVCNMFGRMTLKNRKKRDDKLLTIESDVISPTRLIFMDALLDKETFPEVELDLPYSEVKWEANIDRITSAANPRQTERVPAGAEFNFKIILTLYSKNDLEYLKHLFTAMKLLEDDYLGGSGSRGYGQIEFKNIKIEFKSKEYYVSHDQSLKQEIDVISDLQDLDDKKVEEIKEKINKKI